MSSQSPTWTKGLDAFVKGETFFESNWGLQVRARVVYNQSGVEAFRRPTKSGPVLTELISANTEYFLPWAQRSLSARGIPYVVFPRAIEDRTGIRVLEVIDRQPSGVGAVPNAVVRIRIGQSRIDRYMLTGSDGNEIGWNLRNYFCCLLPSTEVPTSVAHAKEMLKPLPVKIAEANGRKVKRQGDIFAIPLDGRPAGQDLSQRRILGTNHTPDAVIFGEDGNTYGRWWMRHNPPARRPDHGPLHLGERWHLLVRNTVPQTRRR